MNAVTAGKCPPLAGFTERNWRGTAVFASHLPAMRARIALLSFVALAACTSQADKQLEAVKSARSVLSEWALIERQADLAILDRDDELCGIVDDIEMAQEEPGIWQMTALIVGPGAWPRRRPRWLTALLPGGTALRIEAADVASTGVSVRLLKRAEDLGLAKFEQRLLRRFRAH